MVKIYHKVVGSISTNCYLVVNEESNQGIIVDPADMPDSLCKMIDDAKCDLKAILLTHGHFDHIGACDVLRDKYNAKVYAALEEEELLSMPHLNLSASFGEGFVVKADELHRDGDVLELAGMNIKAIHTPGHTIGSCCYYLKDENVLFSGDTLFCESIGRTDFPTGSGAKLRASLRDKLSELPNETDVLPGHGEFTNIGHEKEYNPYM